jgi:hypothetical protein
MGGSDMRIASILGAAVVGLWPGLALAFDMSDFTLKTTEDLYLVCSVSNTDPVYPQASAFCEGFLLGVVSYDYAVADRMHLKRFICYPATATRDEAVAAFVSWAASRQQNTKYMNDPPVKGAVRGLAHKWPCS